MGFMPEDRVRAAQQKQLSDGVKKMRNPNYVRDHPTAGVAGTQRIYRYDNGFGATVDWLYAQPGWRVRKIHFTGMEITSFSQAGPERVAADEDEVHAMLDEIAGNTGPVVDYDLHMGESELERHHRIIAETNAAKTAKPAVAPTATETQNAALSNATFGDHPAMTEDSVAAEENYQATH